MTRVLIAYATTEGQTAKIAAAVAERLKARGAEVQLAEFAALPRKFDLAPFDAAFLCGSLHIGRFQPVLRRFAKAHAEELCAKPSAFIAVSLSAIAEEPDDVEGAKACVEKLIDDTGWAPTAIHHAAGALRFSKYDFFKTWVMKRIAKERGHETAGDEDIEFTDWSALDAFTDEFMDVHVAGSASGEAAQ